MGVEPLSAGLTAAGELAGLAKVIFQWVTEPGGYQDLTIEKKLEKLHEAQQKALMAKDYAALDALIGEYRRMCDKLT
jgi:hypothetical protein